MEKFINDICKDYPLTNNDIHRIFGSQPIILYKDLYKMKNLSEFRRRFKKTKYSPVKYIIVLLEIQDKNQGHWVCLLDFGHYIEYFDSYGNHPDYVHEQGMYFYNKAPILSKLITNSGVDILYNKTKFQKHDEKIQTCGRWITARIKLRDLPLSDFTKLFKSKKYTFDRDSIICALTLLTGAY